MKKEYDFSNGERGKFYRPDAELHLPIRPLHSSLYVIDKSKARRFFWINEVQKGAVCPKSYRCLISARRKRVAQRSSIYIEPDLMKVLREFSKKKGVEVATIVNEWIKKDISIVKTITK
ncbi:hypothetical protein [Candidatus Magnetominusculus dajiuhuensis]|uniref:hypothetical protein n=1 Tax=Candidatus Magnetominusculus dajiuhuensis TaxID=3137712 RepID=UPI003B432B1D